MTVAGKTILLVEQNVRFGLRLATQGTAAESGRVLLNGRAHEVLANPEMADLYFGGSWSRTCCSADRDAGVTARLARWPRASGSGCSSLNRRALVDIEDPYVSTFVNLVIAALALLGVALATEDLTRLLDAGAWPLIAFAAAGVVHFLLGWTFLNLSQRRTWASAHSPLLTMTPLFAPVVAAITLGQLPGASAPRRSSRWWPAHISCRAAARRRGADALPGWRAP